MKLETWIKLSELTMTDFARVAGASREAVYKWRAGIVGARALAQIQAVTGGRVTPLDFHPNYAALGQTLDAKQARERVAANLAKETS